MLIRPALLDDFLPLYQLGKRTQELQVSATEAFMEEDEFRQALTAEDSIFLVAQEDHGEQKEEQEKNIVGFIYANADDKDKPLRSKYACVVYLVVAPEQRRKGIANLLYRACELRCKELGITHLYAWAHLEREGEKKSPIREFLKKQSFNEGHKYVWMDKKIS